MGTTENTEAFVQQITENQTRLYGYVYSLLGDHNRASDVVQETNLVLWRKVAEFDPERPFLPWAFAFARTQVLAHMRDRKRDRLLLDAELAETLSGEAQQLAEKTPEIQTALRACIANLSPENRKLIEGRYVRSISVTEVAAAAERTVSAVKVALMRTRRQLAECVQKRLASEA